MARPITCQLTSFSKPIGLLFTLSIPPQLWKFCRQLVTFPTMKTIAVLSAIADIAP